MKNHRGILLVGSPRDPTFLHTISEFHRQGRTFSTLDIDRFCASGRFEGSLQHPDSIVFEDDGERVALHDFNSCYARFVALPSDWTGGRERLALGKYRLLQVAISAMTALVVNRPWAGESNDSKPYQSALMQSFGLRVPRSCATNEPLVAAEFIRSCADGAIYKSNSGNRSIVQSVTEADLDRLSLLAYCPVFFQERIIGDDVRVHVLATECHSVSISSDQVDYRYDASGSATDRPFAVPPELANLCVGITHEMGLEFSGIDFKISSRDRSFYCLEVNPMPGYHGYDLTLNGSISGALGELLSAVDTPV